MQTGVLVLTLIIIILGIAGTVIPFLPGVPLVFLGIAGYGWYEGFVHVGPRYIIIMGALTLLSVFVDYLATYLGAKWFGSSKKGIWGAVLGLFLGLFLFPPFGLFIGPWVGAFLGELWEGKNVNEAIKTGTGTIIGIFGGMTFKILLGIIMLFSFLIIIF
ncbi:MAG: DUF456 domain-containing protein [Bacillota bacterium]|nr:DUF456 domain-containing protein [Bacillota bacterium]